MGEEITETGDYIVNEKDKVVTLTQDGVKKVEQFFQIDNLSDPENLEIQHNINLALRAHSLMKTLLGWPAAGNRGKRACKGKT